MDSNNHYRTSDTALASFLVTQHHFLLSIDYSKPRFDFIFPFSESLQEDANNYLIGNALSDPSHYARVYKKLTRIINKQCQWNED